MNKEQKTNPKVSRRKEILKTRAEMKLRNKKAIEIKKNESSSWFFEKIKRQIKYQIDLEVKNKIKKDIRDEKEEIPTDLLIIQNIKSDCNKQIYDLKLENLKTMDRFLY